MTQTIHQKQTLRQLFKKKRNALSTKEIEEASCKISHHFISTLLPEIYDAQSDPIFSLYLPSYGEVSTHFIADYFHAHQIAFCYPKITKKDHPLNFIVAEKNQEMGPSAFFPKILEPLEGTKTIPDVIILPLLAFDSKLSRLGMGGGFFDRTIANIKTKKKVTIIGLAYDFQGYSTDIPIETTDQTLDFIVTNSQIISRS